MHSSASLGIGRESLEECFQITLSRTTAPLSALRFSHSVSTSVNLAKSSGNAKLHSIMKEAKNTKSELTIVPIESVARKIFLARGQKVMLDSDVANLYQASTQTVCQAARKHRDRFPGDFMFQLTREEFADLSSQKVNPNREAVRIRFRRLPYVFTEYGIAMLSAMLNGKRPIHFNIQVMRTFIRIRELLQTNKQLAARFEDLEAAPNQLDSVIDLLAQ